VDAGDVLMAIVLIGCAGWIVWVTVTSKRRARESGNKEEAVVADGGPQPPGVPEPPRPVPPEGPPPTGRRARGTRAGRTSPPAGHRRT